MALRSRIAAQVPRNQHSGSEVRGRDRGVVGPRRCLPAIAGRWAWVHRRALLAGNHQRGGRWRRWSGRRTWTQCWRRRRCGRCSDQARRWSAQPPCLVPEQAPQRHRGAGGRAHDRVGEQRQCRHDLHAADAAAREADLAADAEVLADLDHQDVARVVTSTVAEPFGPSWIRAGVRYVSRSSVPSTARARSTRRSRLPDHCCAGGRMDRRNSRARAAWARHPSPWAPRPAGYGGGARRCGRRVPRRPWDGCDGARHAEARRGSAAPPAGLGAAGLRRSSITGTIGMPRSWARRISCRTQSAGSSSRAVSQRGPISARSTPLRRTACSISCANAAPSMIELLSRNTRSGPSRRVARPPRRGRPSPRRHGGS